MLLSTNRELTIPTTGEELPYETMNVGALRAGLVATGRRPARQPRDVGCRRQRGRPPRAVASARDRRPVVAQRARSRPPWRRPDRDDGRRANSRIARRPVPGGRGCGNACVGRVERRSGDRAAEDRSRGIRRGAARRARSILGALIPLPRHAGSPIRSQRESMPAHDGWSLRSVPRPQPHGLRAKSLASRRALALVTDERRGAVRPLRPRDDRSGRDAA